MEKARGEEQQGQRERIRGINGAKSQSLWCKCIKGGYEDSLTGMTDRGREDEEEREREKG